MTIRFEGQPRGQVGVYYEGSMQFRSTPMGALYLGSSGRTGFPDNGTGYLETPDAGSFGDGVTFGPTNAFPASAPFDLISFDAAEFGSLGPTLLTVVGWKPMAGTVTNLFTTDGINDGTGPLQDFQTFNLDSSFVNLFRVDIYGRFSLDNVVISSIPEPSTSALLFLATACAFGRSRIRRMRL